MHRSCGGGVVDEEHPRHETERADARQHGLKRGQDGVVLRCALSWRSDGQHVGQGVLEAPSDRIDVGTVPQDDVDLVHPVFLAEKQLGRRQVHHRQLPADGGREPLGLEETPHDELAHALRGRQTDRAAGRESVATRENGRDENRARIADRLQQLAPVRVCDHRVALKVLLRGEVGAEELQRLRRVVRERDGPPYERYGSRHVRIGPHDVRGSLVEPHLPDAEDHLQRGRTGDELDRPSNAPYDTRVDDADRDDERDACRDPADDERRPSPARAQLRKADLSEEPKHRIAIYRAIRQSRCSSPTPGPRSAGSAFMMPAMTVLAAPARVRKRSAQEFNKILVGSGRLHVPVRNGWPHVRSGPSNAAGRLGVGGAATRSISARTAASLLPMAAPAARYCFADGRGNRPEHAAASDMTIPIQNTGFSLDVSPDRMAASHPRKGAPPSQGASHAPYTQRPLRGSRGSLAKSSRDSRLRAETSVRAHSRSLLAPELWRNLPYPRPARGRRPDRARARRA